MTNEEVILAFLNKSSQLSLTNSNKSLSIFNLKLYTYNIILAQWKKGDLFINCTYYSVTSRKHSGTLLRSIPKNKNYRVFIIDNVPYNASELIYDN